MRSQSEARSHLKFLSRDDFFHKDSTTVAYVQANRTEELLLTRRLSLAPRRP